MNSKPYFEPCPAMMHISKQRLVHLDNITYVEKGLCSHQGEMRFDAKAGSASNLCEHGTSIILVTTLDQAVDMPVSFIKLDIENAEYGAIRGAECKVGVIRPALQYVCTTTNRTFGTFQG